MNKFLTTATKAARAAGVLLMDNYGSDLNVDDFHKHDIKLELDVKSQELISEILLNAFPDHAIYGEEGIAGNQESEYQWVVDPIDGTVNYFYGIPHYCISIALRKNEELILGVILEPNLNELFTVVKGEKPQMNGKEISVSSRDALAQAVVTVGFSKSKESLDAGFKRFQAIAYEVRKTRMLGSAALAMAYIACGRLDAYIEEQISLWDIAAGQLLVEAAGGTVELRTSESSPDKFFICAQNGNLPLKQYI